MMSYSGRSESRFRRTPIGFYDDALVNAETESYFAVLDNYAHRVLKPFETVEDFLKRSTKTEWTQGGSRVGLCYFPDFDPKLLKLFLLSVLWRFASTSIPMGNGISVEPHMSDLRRVLIERDLALGPQFGAHISKLVDGDVAPVLTPIEDRHQGLRIYLMVFGGFMVIIKADKRRFPPGPREIALEEGRPVAIAVDEFRRWRLYENVARSALKTAQRFGSPWKGRFDS